MPDPQKILIIKLSSLGDVIHSLPSLRTLRKSFPDAHIAWMVEEKCKDLLFDNPDLDELIVVRIRHWRQNWNLQNWHEFSACLRQLRRAHFDVVLDLQGLIKTGVIAFLSGAPQRIGFHEDDCRERWNTWFSNQKVPYIGKQVHVIDKNLRMVKALGANIETKEFPLVIPAAAEAKIQADLEAQPEMTARPLVAIHQGVGFETKRWELARFAQLGDRLASELGCNVVLSYGPGEEERIETLSAMMKHKHWISPAQSMHQSMALYKRLSLFVGCDTGPLHLSACLGIPTVAIFGSTDPEYSRPQQGNHEVVVKILHCSFCHKRKCPTQNECMDQVTVADVFGAAQRILSPVTSQASGDQ